VSACQVHFFPQEVDQQRAGLNSFFNGLAVELHGNDFLAHGWSP
jgi:hypothetical protein